MNRTIAAKVIEGIQSQGWEVIGRGGTWVGAMRPLEQYIQRKVERAVRAEREACAKVCDDKAKQTFSSQCQTWGDYFARAIRARGNT